MVTDIPVSSSLLTSAAYDDEAQELHLTFKSNGARWVYKDVPQSEADAFASAVSPGGYFLSQIKGQYTERRA